MHLRFAGPAHHDVGVLRMDFSVDDIMGRFDGSKQDVIEFATCGLDKPPGQHIGAEGCSRLLVSTLSIQDLYPNTGSVSADCGGFAPRDMATYLLPSSTQKEDEMRNLPTRLHHNAYVTADMEATRHFYEDLIGMPLVATWCEADELFGKERVYCHCFFGLADDSALAFFQFANAGDQELFGPKMPPSPFHHIALNCDAETQDRVKERLEAAGYREPNLYVLEHGYCKSLYAADPNGMILELTVDNPKAAEGANMRRATAHADLERWLAGNHSSNNAWRAAEHQPV